AKPDSICWAVALAVSSPEYALVTIGRMSLSTSEDPRRFTLPSSATSFTRVSTAIKRRAHTALSIWRGLLDAQILLYQLHHIVAQRQPARIRREPVPKPRTVAEWRATIDIELAKSWTYRTALISHCSCQNGAVLPRLLPRSALEQ